ncbi:MAG: RNA polymerase sigma factor [Chthoniobacteraceae bacterium]
MPIIETGASRQSSGDLFATTRWTAVIAAGMRGTPQSERAMEELCGAYWYPLYAYVRRRGHTREDAEDLTQAFFSRLLEGRSLEGLSAQRGRFRAFLLASMKHFLANEWDRANRLKRGGERVHLSLDWATADTQFQIADRCAASPEALFDREWALALLERVLEGLQNAYAAEGHGALFSTLQPLLIPEGGEGSITEAARSLGMEEGAIRVALHRLRKRYRKLLREEIVQTLENPAEVEEEMRTLFQAFAAG